MPKRRTVVLFSHESITKPVLKIEDGPRQVVIAFIPFEGEHITLHPQPDGTILRTHMRGKDDKLCSTWDELRVQAARAHGIRDPERHGRYYIHAPLVVVSNMPGYHLTGRHIDLAELPANEKYTRSPHVLVESPEATFMLNLYLSRPENLHTPTSDPYVSTSLGDVFFSFSEARTASQKRGLAKHGFYCVASWHRLGGRNWRKLRWPWVTQRAE